MDSFRKSHYYLKIGLVICLFGALVFSSNLCLKSLGDFSFLAAASQSSQGLFAKPSNNLIRESPDMSFIQKNSLIGNVPPTTVDAQVLGTILGSGEYEMDSGTRTGVVEYVVESGDTLSSIAEKYSISLQTILWANELSSKSVIRPGQKLVILPVTGVVYNVKKGDTLSEIAKKYKGNVSEIIEINELSSEGDIFIGDILVIPNGKMPEPSYPRYASSQVPIGSSYFICPHAACRISQGLHWYNAIDFSGKCGDPVYAAAGGTVQRVKYGWNGGAGNYITIIHPNGVVTMYGHIQKSLVYSGQQVSQGDIVALMGGKPGTSGAGRSTGCHVHFGVRNARNPFAK